MKSERGSNPEELQNMFFDRRVEDVAKSLKGKQLKIGDKEYLITLTEPFHGDNPKTSWNNKRRTEISKMKPGEMVTYGFRGATLSFIKTQGADNIMIRGLRDSQAGTEIASATSVSAILGLRHGARGQLMYDGTNILRYAKKDLPREG